MCYGFFCKQKKAKTLDILAYSLKKNRWIFLFFFTYEQNFLETFLSKTLASIHAKLLTLEKTKHLKPLPMRDLDHHAHGASYDPHFWLDPQQVHVIAQAITQALMAQDPEHANIYQYNYLIHFF